MKSLLKGVALILMMYSCRRPGKTIAKYLSDEWCWRTKYTLRTETEYILLKDVFTASAGRRIGLPVESVCCQSCWLWNRRFPVLGLLWWKLLKWCKQSVCLSFFQVSRVWEKQKGIPCIAGQTAAAGRSQSSRPSISYHWGATGKWHTKSLKAVTWSLNLCFTTKIKLLCITMFLEGSP